MFKKFFGISICVLMLTLFTLPSAQAAFTWFGFSNENTEVMINSSDEPHHRCWVHDCSHKKHKPKPHPKHHPPKKGPKHHDWWWKK